MKIKHFEKETVNLIKLPSILFIFTIYGLLISAILLFANNLFNYGNVISESMCNTFQITDKYISSKIAYSFNNEPKRGDVIDFNAPDDGELYIKRVIGLPGDTVEIKYGVVYVNGEKLEEDYISPYSDNHGPFIVPQEEYFVLGDNRGASYDSRLWQYKYVKKEDIQGKVLFSFNIPKLRFKIH